MAAGNGCRLAWSSWRQRTHIPSLPSFLILHPSLLSPLRILHPPPLPPSRLTWTKSSRKSCTAPNAHTCRVCPHMPPAAPATCRTCHLPPVAHARICPPGPASQPPTPSPSAHMSTPMCPCTRMSTLHARICPHSLHLYVHTACPRVSTKHGHPA
eukprot:95369-Chlamydomonas_euryale.AAC.1